MSKLMSKHLIFHGHVEAYGMYFDFDLLSQEAVHSRILALWNPGMRLYELETGLVVLFDVPVDVRAKFSPGLPMASHKGYFVGLPLDEASLSELGAPAGSIIIAKHGQLVHSVLTKQISPSSWIDVSNFELSPTKPLGTIQSIPQELEPGSIERWQFSGVPELSPDAARILEQLKNNAAATKTSAITPGESATATGEIFSSLAGIMFSMLAWFLILVRRPVHSVPMKPNQAGTRSAAAPAPTNQERMQNVKLMLHNSMVQFLSAIGVLPFIRAQQAKYLNKMLDLLTRGDWEEALRYAIPLCDENGGTEAIAEFLGIPELRKSFDIGTGQRTTSSAMGMDDRLYDHLKSLYRRAFEQLDQTGKIGEAAFVLAELLQAHEEAVSYLERRERFKLAAELAEARKLSPALIVRLWLLARDTTRAVSIARLKNCFEAAVAMLESMQSPMAPALRTHWAHSLVESGNYEAAIEVVWEMPEFRPLTEAWLKLALEARGEASGQLLARHLLRLPDSLEEIKPKIDSLLSDRNRENASSRHAFLCTLIESNMMSSPEVQCMARSALRTLLRDLSAGHISISKGQLKNLTNATNERTLWADLSSIQLPGTRTTLTESRDIQRIEIREQGTRSLSDAAFLPNGKCVIACGETGVCIINSRGNITHQFRSPANQLVMSIHGDRTIAVAHRGEARRLTRLNLLSHESVDMGELRLSTMAAIFDGSTWIVYGEEGLLVVDATAPKCKALWRMPNLTTDVVAIGTDCKNAAFVTSGLITKDQWGRPVEAIHKYEKYLCDAHDLQLRHRIAVPGITPGTMIQVSPRGRVITARLTEPSPDTGRQDFNFSCDGIQVDRVPTEPTTDFTIEEIEFSVSADWVALTLPVSGGIECHIRSITERSTGLIVFLPEATKANAKIQTDLVTICDDRGRLLVLELQYGRLIRNLRIK